MAYVSNYDPEKQQNQPGGPIAPGGASNTVQVSPSGGVGSVGGATASPTKEPGGQFASLNQYVNANQGAAQPLAGQITSGIGQQYNTLQNQNQQTLQGIGNQVSNAYTKQNDAILAQEAANPVSFASNPENIKAFQGQLNNQYTGPNQAESTAAYQQQLANVNQAISQGNAQVGTDVGRQQLLSQYERKPTAGVTGLNSAILAQNPNAQAQIEQAYQPFSNLISGLQTGAGTINQQIGQAQTEAQKSSEQANKQIQEQAQNLQSGLQNQYNSAVNQVNQYNTALPEYGNQIQDLNRIVQDWNNYYTSVPNFGIDTFDIQAPNFQQLQAVNAPTMENTATQQQYQTGQALQQLAGSQFNPFSPSINTSQIGTFIPPSGNTNVQPYAQQIAQALNPALEKSKADWNAMTANLTNAYPANTVLFQNLQNKYNELQKELEKYGATSQAPIRRPL